MTHSLLFRLGLMAALLAPIPANAQSEPKPPAVTVTGEATIAATPDIAFINAGVTSQAKSARDAMAASGKTMTAILAALKSAGIPDSDIQTSQLQLEPIHEPNKRAANVIALEATSLLTVRVRDVSKAADILDMMITAGANVVTGISFAVSDTSKLLDQARAEAISDARRKAEIYAKAAGVTLGRPLSISEGYIARARIQSMAKREAAMPVRAGEENIGINVSVAYELLR